MAKKKKKGSKKGKEEGFKKEASLVLTRKTLYENREFFVSI